MTFFKLKLDTFAGSSFPNIIFCLMSVCYISSHVPTLSFLSLTAASPTFPLDAVVLLTVLVRQRVGARLRQHVLWGARDPVFTLGVLGAQGAGGGHPLDFPAEWALAGTHPLTHCTARHYWILLGTTCREKQTLWVPAAWCIVIQHMWNSYKWFSNIEKKQQYQ